MFFDLLHIDWFSELNVCMCLCICFTRLGAAGQASGVPSLPPAWSSPQDTVEAGTKCIASDISTTVFGGARHLSSGAISVDAVREHGDAQPAPKRQGTFRPASEARKVGKYGAEDM